MFEKYKYICALYEEKSFTKAAKRLYISQPSLSAAVKKIESDLGAPLFERNGHDITVTDVGKIYIEGAEKIKVAEEEFHRRFNDIYDVETGSITVGGTNYLSSSHLLPGIINAFLTAHPKVSINLVEATSHQLRQMVMDNKIDIVIDSFDKNIGGYKGYPITQEQILLCVPAHLPVNNSFRDHQISPGRIFDGSIDLDTVPPVPLSCFSQEDFILLKSGNDMHNRANAILKSEGITPKIKFSVDQMNIAYALSASGSGISFVTDTLFKYAKFKNDVVLYTVNKEQRYRSLYVAHNKAKYCTRAMDAFIQTARDVAK